MSKKYVTRRFRKLHKGRKGYTTRKKMDGGWRMWTTELSQFKSKINDVPKLKEALDSYRNTGTSAQGETDRTKILEEVREICREYQTMSNIKGNTQFYALKDFVMGNVTLLENILKLDSNIEKKKFYQTLFDILRQTNQPELSATVSAVGDKNLKWRNPFHILRSFKSHIKNVLPLKSLLKQYKDTHLEDHAKRLKILEEVKNYIMTTKAGIGNKAVDLKFIELLYVVLNDSSSQTLSNFINDDKNPIDKREFYQAVYDSLVSTPLNVTPLASQAAVSSSASNPASGVGVPALSSASNSSVAASVPAPGSMPSSASSSAHSSLSSSALSSASNPASNSSLAASVPALSSLSNSASSSSSNSTVAAGVLAQLKTDQSAILPPRMSLAAPQVATLPAATLLSKKNSAKNVRPVTFNVDDESYTSSSALQNTLPMPPSRSGTEAVANFHRSQEQSKEGVFYDDGSPNYDSTLYVHPSASEHLWDSRVAFTGQQRSPEDTGPMYASTNLFDRPGQHGMASARQQPRENKTLIWENGDKYVGSVVNDQPHGEGLMTFVDGYDYEGDFSYGKKEGYGTFRWQDGAFYQGEWHDDNMEGYGKFHYADGNEYNGNWKDGKMNGYGIQSYAVDGEIPDDYGGGPFNAGDRYEGGFKDDKRHGGFSYKFFNGDDIKFGTYVYRYGKCPDFDEIQKRVRRQFYDRESVVSQVPITGSGSLNITEDNVSYHGSFDGKPEGKENHRFWVYPLDKKTGDPHWDTHETADDFCKDHVYIGTDGPDKDLMQYECRGHRGVQVGGTAYKPNRRKTNKKITRKRKSPRKSPRKSTRKSPRKSHRK
jgi:hypothetical protein